MNQAQINWLCKQIDELINFYESNIPLSDEKAEEINTWIHSTVEKAKGKTDDCREEVRAALLDVVEVYAFADPQYIACMKKYGLYEESMKRLMNRWSEEQRRWFEGVGKHGKGTSD